MRKQPLVVANWKTYIETPEAAKQFIAALKRKSAAFAGVEAWIAPPATLVGELAKSLKSNKIKVGAQNISPYGSGAHTGEVTVEMLHSAGASFAIVGHSERRAMGEQNEAIRQELSLVAGAGLTPILCVGERAREAEGAHFSFIEEQLSSATRGSQSLLSKFIVAYEPVWAIGKSAEHAMKPFELQEMVIFIRKTLAAILGRKDALKTTILYGGSVEPQNTRGLLIDGDVDGFLVGHASAELSSFVEILQAASEAKKR